MTIILIKYVNTYISKLSLENLKREGVGVVVPDKMRKNPRRKCKQEALVGRFAMTDSLFFFF